MAKMIQNNFGGGEISPVLYGRSDLQTYYKGCADAENFVVSKEGTLRKRRGIKSFAELPGDGLFRLGAYLYDRTTALLLVFASVDGALSCYAYDKAGQNVFVTSLSVGATAIEALQMKQIGDQIWVTNGVFFKILTITHDESAGTYTCVLSEWSQAAKPNPVKAFSCKGYSEIDAPYNGDGEATVEYCAFIVRDGVMSSLTKKSAYQKKAWVAGAYVNCKVEITEAQRNTMDYVVIGKSNGGRTNYGELARYYKEDFLEEGKLYLTYVDKNVSPGEAVYSQTNVLGEEFSNPLCVDCYQQRRVFANAHTEGNKYPMTLWFSEVGNLTNFYSNRPSTDADAFSPTIASTGPAFIRWICAFQENMILFTDAGLFSVGFSQTGGFSASSCRISRFSQLKVSPDIQPVVTDAGIVFVGADNKTLYTASYNLQENTLKPINRTVLVEHLTRNARITSIGLQEYPDNVVWIAMEDGRFASFVYETNEEVYGWSHSVIDGAKVLSLVSLGSVTDGESARTFGDIGFVVERGDTKYLAFFSNEYVDDIGGVRKNVNAKLTTLRPESQERTIAGAKKNLKDVIIRLYETGGIAVRPEQGTDLPLVVGRMSVPYSGDVKIMPRGLVTEEGQLTLVSDNDMPCEILQIVTSIEVAQ